MNNFINNLNLTPCSISFEETMSIIEENYTFTETAFSNGNTSNKAGENSGSCKLFSFAKLNELTQQQTLNCFGQYYQDVLNTPNDNDHQNIRQFMINGWDGIKFESIALKSK